MRKLQLSVFGVGVLLIGGLSGCSNKSVDPSSTYYDQNDKDIQAYATKNNLNGKTTATGLYYATTVAKPDAKLAAQGDELEFAFKSYNIKDVLIDSTQTTKPVYYPLGIGAILAGLEEGLALMHEGETTKFLLPSYLAYGSADVSANLPAYSVVRFDVTLKRSRSEDQQIDEYIANNKLTLTQKTASGLRFILTKADSTAGVPAVGKTLTIKYSGRQLRAATPFDSTGSGTFDAVLGQNKYVKGFEEGLAKMKVGQKATIIFPSSLGYGTTGVPSNNTYTITPYAPLRFDLELISAK